MKNLNAGGSAAVAALPPKEERFFRFPGAGSSAKFPEERKLGKRCEERVAGGE
jgi:hypothetical protein